MWEKYEFDMYVFVCNTEIINDMSQVIMTDIIFKNSPAGG